MEAEKNVIDNIREYHDLLFSAEKKVADYILKHTHKVLMMNVSKLAGASGVSDATVVRMCKHLGYKGYNEMRLLLSRDMGKKDMEFDSKAPIDSVQMLFRRLAHNISSLAKNTDISTYLECVNILKASNTVYILAAGNTSPLAMEFGFRLERFKIRAIYSTVPEYSINHLSLGGKDDTLLVISRSGTSRHIVHAIEFAHEMRMKIIAITADKESPLTKLATHILFSTTNKNIFKEPDPNNHLCEMAVCDALLYFIKNGEAFQKDANDTDSYKHNEEMEILLSEFQL